VAGPVAAGANDSTEPGSHPEEVTMRITLAVLMLLHGVAHVPGFLVPWRLMREPDGGSLSTRLLGGINVGETGLRLLGLGWLLLAVAFVVAAAATWVNRESWPAIASLIAVISLVFTILELPESRIGVVVNLALLAAIFAATRLGWV
jgi:hypothetical protein